MDASTLPLPWEDRVLPVLVSLIEKGESEEIVRWTAESLASHYGAPAAAENLIKTAEELVQNYSDTQLERANERAKLLVDTAEGSPSVEPLRLRDVRKGSLFVYKGTTYKKTGINTGKPRYGNEIEIPSDSVVTKPIKPPSRQDRWNKAVQDARDALNDWRDVVDQVNDAFETLREVQSEFEEWKDNLDGKFEGSALSEKLETVVGLDLEADAESDSLSDLEGKLDEAEGAELPLGFGRD